MMWKKLVQKHTYLLTRLPTRALNTLAIVEIMNMPNFVNLSCCRTYLKVPVRMTSFRQIYQKNFIKMRLISEYHEKASVENDVTSTVRKVQIIQQIHPLFRIGRTEIILANI